MYYRYKEREKERKRCIILYRVAKYQLLSLRTGESSLSQLSQSSNKVLLSASDSDSSSSVSTDDDEHDRSLVLQCFLYG